MSTSSHTMSVSSPAAPAVPVTLRANLAVRLLSQDGAVLAWREVRPDDLADVRGEIWLRQFLEQDLSTSMDDVAIEVAPIPVPGDARVGELQVLARGPGRRVLDVRYDSGILRHVAMGLQEALLQGRPAEQSRDTESQTLYHDLVTITRAPVPAQALEAAIDAVAVSSRARPPVILEVRLSGLSRRPVKATPGSSESEPRVYITAEALDRAKSASRAGAAQHPPIETGAVLLGTLCRCPESGLLYLVLIDALPLRDDVRQEFSLTLTSLTWSHIMTIVRARQQSCPAIHLAGQAHGHNWDPGPKCAACDTTPACGRTTLFLSHADVQWQRAVFPEAPWACALIFGSNARGDLLDAVFTVSSGRYAQVNYGRLDRFDPAAWPIASPNHGEH